LLWVRPLQVEAQTQGVALGWYEAAPLALLKPPRARSAGEGQVFVQFRLHIIPATHLGRGCLKFKSESMWDCLNITSLGYRMIKRAVSTLLCFGEGG
jgi:hypothetical protein